MSDENSQDQKPDIKQIRIQNKVTKIEAIKVAKQLQRPDSQWTLLQEILQDIIAGYKVQNPDSLPRAHKLTEDLKKEVENRYSDNEEVKNILLAAIPSSKSVREWLNKDGWEDAVWARIRGEQLFSHEKRAQVIEALRSRAMDKSDVAAKIWLTLSGDYSDKMEVNDKTVDTYREINTILHNKKE